MQEININSLLKKYNLTSDEVGLVTNNLIRRAIVEACENAVDLCNEVEQNCYNKSGDQIESVEESILKVKKSII